MSTKKIVRRARKLMRGASVAEATRDSGETRQVPCGPTAAGRPRQTVRPGLNCPATARHPPPPGAIAQLGERLDRTQEVAGSSPASSMVQKVLQSGTFLFAHTRAITVEEASAATRRVHAKSALPRSAGRERLELEARRAAEDSVVRDERDPQPDGGGGDPSVGRVRLLGERVAGRLAVGAKLCVDGDELRAAVDDLDPIDLRFHL